MPERLRRWFDRAGWRRTIIGVPYVWLGVFFLLPFLIVLAMSLATRAMTAPPFAFAPDFPFVEGCPAEESGGYRSRRQQYSCP